MSGGRQKIEEWLRRCNWLAETRLDDQTRARLQQLTRGLRSDLEEEIWKTNGEGLQRQA
jgi:hypothetical protein